MLVLVGVADDPSLTVSRPGEQLGQVVDDDGDERQVEVRDPAADVGLDEPGVEVVRGEQVPDHVDGLVVNFGFPGKIKRINIKIRAVGWETVWELWVQLVCMYSGVLSSKQN